MILLKTQQVFRSAIDSSYLPLLQDWLLCSMPNFLSFPVDKAVWCLTIIFVSASINLHLIKIFPEILAKYSEVRSGNEMVGFDIVTDTANKTSCANNFKTDREIVLFCLACKDFNNRLSDEQRVRFKDVFTNCESREFKVMLETL